MRHDAPQFLKNSLVAIIMVCVFAFLFLAVALNRESTQTLDEVGSIYMTGMNERLTKHFETTIEYHLSHVQDIADHYPSGSADSEELYESIIDRARLYDLTYVGFCTPSGEIEMIYGSPANVPDKDSFVRSLSGGERKVVSGIDVNGKYLTLLGVPAEYTMPSGEKSLALVAGLSMDYFMKIFSLDETNSLISAHAIRRDGSLVIADTEGQRNYFDSIRDTFGKGRNGDKLEETITNISDVFNHGEDFSASLKTIDERCMLHCSRLPYTEWALITVMPYGELDETVGQFSSNLVIMVVMACGAILITLIATFYKYFGYTRKQLQNVEVARAEAEEARLSAEHASRAKSEFLSNMSHDIRTPMNAIVGMTAVATANIDNKQQVQNCLRKITISSRHLLGLINDILDMSKIESGKMTLGVDQVSLREMIEGIVSIVQPQVKAKGQSFDVSIRGISTENVCCDSVRLNQVLINLLSNAIKFTPDGGDIRISMRQEPSPKGEDHVRTIFSVKDNGIGMSEELQSRVYELFVREDSARVRKTEGSGLGMAITKYIVDAMGGDIEIISALGEGSEFIVTLDLEKAQVEEADMILPEWNMLVVDDDRQLCESAVEALGSIGINASWTLSGEDAVKMVVERHEERDDFHIILLDWKLPGMDGLETARNIRKHLGDEIPILLISAYDWAEIESEAREAGINGFIAKPLFRSTLFYGLRKFAGDDDAEEPLPVKTAIDLTGLRVLLAEDNELNWEIAYELLSALGLELDWAENGEICVEKFQASEPGYYDAILMDLRMPVMTGEEATVGIRSLEREDKDIPIIAMTADAFAEDAERCMQCGMNAHIAKPIDVDEVARLLQKFTRDI